MNYSENRYTDDEIRQHHGRYSKVSEVKCTPEELIKFARKHAGLYSTWIHVLEQMYKKDRNEEKH